MAIIIDTYNCVHAGMAMGGPMKDLTVRKLCQWIVSNPARTKTTLVIDGRPKPDEPSENEFPDLHLAYSGAGVKADTVIGQMVARSTNRKNLTVITNDRAVASAARRAGAQAQSCEAFLQGLVTAHRAGAKLAKGALPLHKTKGPDKAQTEHWLKEFGVGEVPDQKKPKIRDENDIDDLDMKGLLGF